MKAEQLVRSVGNGEDGERRDIAPKETKESGLRFVRLSGARFVFD